MGSKLGSPPNTPATGTLRKSNVQGSTKLAIAAPQIARSRREELGSDLRALEFTDLRSMSRRAPRAQHSWDPRSTARTPGFGRKMPIHKVRILSGEKKLGRIGTSERRSPGFGTSEGRSPAPPPEMLLKEPNERNVKDLHLTLNTLAGPSN